MDSNTNLNNNFIPGECKEADEDITPFITDRVKEGLGVLYSLLDVLQREGLCFEHLAFLVGMVLIEVADDNGRGDALFKIMDAWNQSSWNKLANECEEIVNLKFKVHKEKISKELFEILLPVWRTGDGHRHELSMAIDGTLLREGFGEYERIEFFRKLAFSTGKGKDHTHIPHESEKRMKQKGAHIYGRKTLFELVDKIMGSHIND